MLGKKTVQLVSFGIFLSILLGFSFCFSQPINNGFVNGVSVQAPIQTSYSNSPSSPYVMLQRTSIQESYPSADSYYYKTESPASVGYYQIVWVQPQDLGDSFNLYLYNDSAYSTLVRSCSGEAGYLNWVILRPSSVLYLYPKVVTDNGGNGVVEWENGTQNLAVCGYQSNTMSSIFCGDLWTVHLEAGKSYNFSLQVPSTGDFNMFLHYLALGGASGPGDNIGYSDETGNGIDELIANFVPDITDDYGLVIVRANGTGDYRIDCLFSAGCPSGGIPAFEIGLGLFAVMVGILIAVHPKKSSRFLNY